MTLLGVVGDPMGRAKSCMAWALSKKSLSRSEDCTSIVTFLIYGSSVVDLEMIIYRERFRRAMADDGKPLASIMVSYYHGIRYLPRFLENITKQSFFDETEFLMDLNEPSAEELKLVKAFQEKYPGRLRVFIQEKVVPYGASWNRCIKNASTDFVGVWNVDDLRTEDSIRIQYEYLRTHADIEVVTGPFEIIGSVGDGSGVMVNNSERFEDYHIKRFYLGPFWMLKRSICERAGYFDEQLRSSADYDLAVRLAMHGRIAFIDTCMGKFLDEGRGLSTSANTVGGIENVVVGLRYGIFELMNFALVPCAMRYRISQVLSDGQWKPVNEYIPPSHRMSFPQRFARLITSPWDSIIFLARSH